MELSTWIVDQAALTVEGADAVGADADVADGDLQLLFEEFEVGDEVGGELGGVGEGGEVRVPAGEGEIFGGDGGELAGVGELGSAFAGGGAVVGASPDFGEGVEDVGLHEVKFGDTIEHDGVAEGGQVYPAGAAGAAGGGAELAPGLANLLADFVVELGGERAAADAGAVGFGDAVHLIDVARGDAEAGAGAGGDSAGRGDVGIGAEVDI